MNIALQDQLLQFCGLLHSHSPKSLEMSTSHQMEVALHIDTDHGPTIIPLLRFIRDIAQYLISGPASHPLYIPHSYPHSKSMLSPARRTHSADELFVLTHEEEKAAVDPATALWLPTARAIAEVIVQLCKIPTSPGSDPSSQRGVTAELDAALKTAQLFCTASKELREIILKRVLRKWPTGMTYVQLTSSNHFF